MTSEGCKLRVEGKLHHEDEEAPEPGFGAVLEEQLLGAGDVAPPTPFWEQLTASIVEVSPPGDQWIFSVRRDYVPGQPLLPRGTITNGIRTMDIETTTSHPDAVGNLLETHEDGFLLGHWTSTQESDYFPGADLSPQPRAPGPGGAGSIRYKPSSGASPFPLVGSLLTPSGNGASGPKAASKKTRSCR